jgi:DNA-binding CsgD family transcriptional regulator
MESLTFNDTQSLLHAIQSLHALHDLNTFYGEALAVVDQLVPSEIPEFHITQIQSRQVSRTFLPGYSGYAPDMEQVFYRHFTEHPIICNMPHTLGGAYKVSDFISREQCQSLAGFYQQFLRVIGCEDQMVLFVSGTQPQSWDKYTQGNATLLGISLNRSQRNFTERDRLILNLLSPHLSQAHCNAQQYQRLQQDLSQLHQTLNHLGLVVLSSEGKVQRVTPQAVAWLEAYFSKPTSSFQLPGHLWAWVKHQISCATLESNFSKAQLPLRIEQAGRQLVIRLVVEQRSERYLLLLEEQILSLSNSLELLGLSQRETEVLFWIMQGKDNKAIAAQLSVGQSTVRKHLESIYHKLGVQSRTEAIAQALTKLGVLNPLPLG